MKRQDEDYDEQVEESLQDEVSDFEEFFYSSKHQDGNIAQMCFLLI